MFDIISQIAETPNLVHLVYRAQPLLLFDEEFSDRFKNFTFTRVEVITLKRHENTWTLSGEVEAMFLGYVKLTEMAAEISTEEGNSAPRKAPSRPAKAGKPVRKP